MVNLPNVLSADLHPFGVTTSRATNTGAQKISGQTNPRARLHQGDADFCAGGASGYSRFIPPGAPSRPWQLIRFRRFRSSLLALASLDLACRDHRPDFSATFTTIAFDDSSLQWLGISDLIAEPEGPSFISRTVTQPPCGPALLVTQDPIRTFTWRVDHACIELEGVASSCVERYRLRISIGRAARDGCSMSCCLLLFCLIEPAVSVDAVL